MEVTQERTLQLLLSSFAFHQLTSNHVEVALWRERYRCARRFSADRGQSSQTRARAEHWIDRGPRGAGGRINESRQYHLHEPLQGHGAGVPLP